MFPLMTPSVAQKHIIKTILHCNVVKCQLKNGHDNVFTGSKLADIDVKVHKVEKKYCYETHIFFILIA